MRLDDMNVNITKEKKQTNLRSSSADEAIRLIPPRDMTLETAIEFIADGEYVEVTPKSIRLSTRRSVPNAGRKSAPAWMRPPSPIHSRH
jgi:GTP-binding protein